MTNVRHSNFGDDLNLWFSISQRSLPWRGIADPYRIWISETMLQQTQVVKVVDYYNRFLQRFPTIQTLAQSGLQDVLKLWEGLGYYSRARNLHRAANMICQEHAGQIPQEYHAFRRLPGVGDYTAAAVLSIAYNQPFPAVDGNVRRVLSRLLTIDAPINSAAAQKIYAVAAERIFDARQPGNFNQAMMELGALICRPANPHCENCPVATYCQAFLTKRQGCFPQRLAAKPVPERYFAAGIIQKGDTVLIVQRPQHGLLGGLWEFPNDQIMDTESSEQACVRAIREHTGLEILVKTPLLRLRHAFTHFKQIMDTFICEYHTGEISLQHATDYRWVDAISITQFPFPKMHQRLILQLQQDVKQKSLDYKKIMV